MLVQWIACWELQNSEVSRSSPAREGRSSGCTTAGRDDASVSNQTLILPASINFNRSLPLPAEFVPTWIHSSCSRDQRTCRETSSTGSRSVRPRAARMRNRSFTPSDQALATSTSSPRGNVREVRMTVDLRHLRVQMQYNSSKVSVVEMLARSSLYCTTQQHGMIQHSTA